MRFNGDEDGHFQCGAGPESPQLIRTFKVPLNGDCRDVLNLNAIQAMLNRICNTPVR